MTEFDNNNGEGSDYQDEENMTEFDNNNGEGSEHSFLLSDRGKIG